MKTIIWKVPIGRLRGDSEFPLGPPSSGFADLPFLTSLTNYFQEKEVPMFRIKNLGVPVIAMLLGLAMFISVAPAQQPVEWTQCFSGTLTLGASTDELRVFTIDSKGIVMSNLESKVFDNMTSHCIGATKVIAGQATSVTYSKFQDPDGDFVVLETTAAPGEKDSTFNFLVGTGKWKGIKGSGKIKVIARGKPIQPGTFQICYKGTGTFELPK